MKSAKKKKKKYPKRNAAFAAEKDGALKETEKGLSYSEYGAMYYVYLVAATEKGDSALVKTAKEKIEALGIGYTERMSEYLSGKLSSKQLFTEGTGDVE